MKIGIYNPYVETKGGGEKVMLAMAAYLSNVKNYEVILITHDKIDFELLGDYFGLDLRKIKHQRIRFPKYYSLIHRLLLPTRVKNLLFDIRVLRSLKKAHYDLFINNCFQSNLPNPARLGIYMCMFPQKLKPGKEVSSLKRSYVFMLSIVYRILAGTTKPSVYSYDLITANSAYTQSYIKKYWDLDCEILYPICEDMKAPTDRKKIILNVGRFFENYGENHHKCQDFLLDQFAKMTNLHKDGWELHFAGTVAEDLGGLRFILGLTRKAENLPVRFHFNCSFGELKKLYNQASIYWHATGYGSDPNKHPEKQEHFGITTVEAMSAGVIPVVLDAAGQRETVKNGDNGFLWKSPKALSDITTKVVKMNPAPLSALRINSINSSKRYNEQMFEKRLDTIFDGLISK